MRTDPEHLLFNRKRFLMVAGRTNFCLVSILLKMENNPFDLLDRDVGAAALRQRLDPGLNSLQVRHYRIGPSASALNLILHIVSSSGGGHERRELFRHDLEGDAINPGEAFSGKRQTKSDDSRVLVDLAGNLVLHPLG